MIVTGPELRRYFEGNVSEISDDAQFIGRIDGESLLGVVAVWNWDGHGCEAGWAGEPGWLSRGFLRFVFAYIFGQMGCHRVTGRIDASDLVCLEQARRLGFVREGLLREAAADGQDILIFGLLKTECKWYG